MPTPPLSVDLRGLLEEMLQKIQDATVISAARHEEVLMRLSEQQQTFTEQLLKLSSTKTDVKLDKEQNAAKEQLPELNSTKTDVNSNEEFAMDEFTMPRRLISSLQVEHIKSHLTRESSLPFGNKGDTPVHKESWRNLAHNLMISEKFDLGMATLILANSFVMCFEVQYTGLQVGFDLRYMGSDRAASDTWPHAKEIFNVFEWIFGIVFVCEIVLKVSALGRKYFIDLWNWLDCISAIAFCFEKGVATSTPVDAQAFRLLRLVRVARLVRLLRHVSSLDMLYIMTTAMRGMTTILVYSVALLAVILMSCAMLLTQFLHTTYFDGVSVANLTQQQLLKHTEMYDFFGTFTRSLLSMFELTLANWPPVTRLLMEEVSEP